MNVNEPNSVVNPETEVFQPEISELSTEESADRVSEKKFASRQEVVNRLKELIDRPVAEVKDEVEVLRSIFYRMWKQEVDEQKKIHLDNGGEEESFQPAIDSLEEELKQMLIAFRDKKAAIVKEVQEEKENNLKIKYQIIEELRLLTEEAEDVAKRYNEFQQLQTRWKEITNLPQTNMNELWKNYQLQVERFYDLLKINKELREYDFKKNLELKLSLCEAAEKLTAEADVVSAFHNLQKLHDEWREIGPVAKELREEIWGRFKDISSQINKRHQQHFESLRAEESKNEEEKTRLCVQAESIDFETLTTSLQWKEKTEAILQLQQEWKKLGFASRKVNTQLFERFRSACDLFFNRKYAFFRTQKDELSVNLKRKEELCAIAESLKDSTAWKETADKLVELQKEWKSIGSVPRKHSDELWKRFVTACDTFFNTRKQALNSSRDSERGNMSAKKAVIRKIKALEETIPQAECIAQLKELIAEYNAIGHVPFKEKDKIYNDFHEAVDAHYKRLNIKAATTRINNFKNNFKSKIEGTDNRKEAILRERWSLLKTHDALKADLQTYENNIGFLTFSSKGANKFQQELEKKIQKLRDEMDEIVKKIAIIDESIENE